MAIWVEIFKAEPNRVISIEFEIKLEQLLESKGDIFQTYLIRSVPLFYFYFRAK
jgi:hypothetical protein